MLPEWFQNMKPGSEQKQYHQPTVESLQKLQKILIKRLGREVSLQETALAHHTLMNFAFALVDMAPTESISFLEKPLANSKRKDI